jgi:hypothetical protein
VTTKNGRYYLKQNLLEKDVGVAIIFKARVFAVSSFHYFSSSQLVKTLAKSSTQQQYEIIL